VASWGYGLLGPVEVRVDGRAVPLPGSRQRLVLTMLLVDVNRVVPAARLIDERAGAHHDAAVLYGAVTSAGSGAPPFGADADRLRESAARLHRHLTETEFRTRVDRGEQMDGSQVIHFALEAIARAASR
jgi:hypothetical protein